MLCAVGRCETPAPKPDSRAAKHRKFSATNRNQPCIHHLQRTCGSVRRPVLSGISKWFCRQFSQEVCPVEREVRAAAQGGSVSGTGGDRGEGCRGARARAVSDV